MTLKEKSDEQLNQCCQTLCQKSHVEAYIQYLEGRVIGYEQKESQRMDNIDKLADLLKEVIG